MTKLDSLHQKTLLTQLNPAKNSKRSIRSAAQIHQTPNNMSGKISGHIACLGQRLYPKAPTKVNIYHIWVKA